MLVIHRRTWKTNIREFREKNTKNKYESDFCSLCQHGNRLRQVRLHKKCVFVWDNVIIFKQNLFTVCISFVMTVCISELCCSLIQTSHVVAQRTNRLYYFQKTYIYSLHCYWKFLLAKLQSSQHLSQFDSFRQFGDSILVISGFSKYGRNRTISTGSCYFKWFGLFRWLLYIKWFKKDLLLASFKSHYIFMYLFIFYILFSSKGIKYR